MQLHQQRGAQMLHSKTQPCTQQLHPCNGVQAMGIQPYLPCSLHNCQTQALLDARPPKPCNGVQAMGIQRYLFFSIHNCQKHPNVPLMRIKSTSEDFLQQSGVPYTIFRLCGFMQVLPQIQARWVPASKRVQHPGLRLCLG